LAGGSRTSAIWEWHFKKSKIKEARKGNDQTRGKIKLDADTDER
jgi:hypothetical protein